MYNVLKDVNPNIFDKSVDGGWVRTTWSTMKVDYTKCVTV